MNVQKYNRGETVPIWAENRDWAEALQNPTAGVKVTVTDSTGATVVASTAAMTNISTGLYVYYWNSPSTATLGWYDYQCKAVDGSGDTARTTIQDGAFQLI
jgi:phosphatidate phosphatase APP1